jgi:hypothetical protein
VRASSNSGNGCSWMFGVGFFESADVLPSACGYRPLAILEGCSLHLTDAGKTAPAAHRAEGDANPDQDQGHDRGSEEPL